MQPARIALAVTLSSCLWGQSTHLGIPAGQCVVLEGIVTSPTERKWTLFQGGVIHPPSTSAVYRVPGDRKLVLTDMKVTVRGQVGKGANVVLSAKQGIQNFQFFKLTVRLLTGLDQNVHSEHFTTPTVLGESSELSVFVSAANSGVALESCHLYGYFLPSGN